MLRVGPRQPDLLTKAFSCLRAGWALVSHALGRPSAETGHEPESRFCCGVAEWSCGQEVKGISQPLGLQGSWQSCTALGLLFSTSGFCYPFLCSGPRALYKNWHRGLGGTPCCAVLLLGSKPSNHCSSDPRPLL